MIKTVDKSEFIDTFSDMGRSENFSRDGRIALFDYLEEYEESTGEQIEFDPIVLCVEYTEYEDLKELQTNYTDIKDMEDLRDHTTVIEIPGTDSFIIQDY